MFSRRKRPVPFQTKRLVAPRTGVGGVLTITGETVASPPEEDSGRGASVLPSSRTENATQYQEVGSAKPFVNEVAEFTTPEEEITEEPTPLPPQPTPERFFSSWAQDMAAAEASERQGQGSELTLPNLTHGRTPQFAIQAPPSTTSKIRASTTPATKRLPGIPEPSAGGGRPVSGRRTALPPYYVKSSLDDVERLPAIHPSVWASRGEKKVEYRGFVTAPPVSATPPTTAPRRGSALQLNTIPLKRPSAVQKKEEPPAPCWRCALHLEHSKCETTKYIRIGGGYRHSYWFVRQMIERARQEELRRLTIIRGEQRKIFQEKLMWRVGADGKRERRIKTFIRTSSGRRIAQYQYVPEDVFEDMMQLREGGSESAKRRLQERLAAAGISEDQIDANWDPDDIGLDDIALDEEGNLLLDEFGEPIDMADTDKLQRAMERRHKQRRGRLGSDDEESHADSGLAFDEKEERERRRRRDESRRRRHRRRHSSDSRSYSESDGSDRSRRRSRRRRHRRRRDDDSGGSSGDESDRSRRRRRRRRRHRSGSEASDYSSESDRSRHRRRRRHRRRDGSEDSGSESDRSRRHRRRRRHRRHDDSEDSGSESDRSRRRRHRRHRRRSYSGSSSSRSRHRSRKKDRHRRRRRHSDSESTSYSDDSSEDSRSRRRRHRRHRRHSSDYSDSESDEGRHGRRRKDKKDRRHRRRYSTSTEESSAGDEKPSKRDRRRRDRRKKYYSDSSETDSDDSYRSRGHRKKKHRKPPRPPSTSSSDLSSEASSGTLRGMTKEKRREYERRRREKEKRKERRQEMREEYERYVEKKERKKERRARRERGEPVSDSSSDYEWGDGKTAVKYGKGSRRRHDRKDSDDYRDIGYDDPNDPWKKKDRRRREGKKKDRSRRHGDEGSSDEMPSSESEFDFNDPSGRKKKKDKKKLRGRGAGDVSSDSEESIYEDVFNEDGTIERKKIKVPKQRKKKEKIYADDELDQESEYESIDSADADRLIARQIYDKDGEVIRLTRSGRRIKDGKISKEVFDLDKHKQKKEKKKKEKQLLERSYEEEYVEEFVDDEGQVVRVVKKRLKGQTQPGRRPATPLTGPRRVQVLFLKGGKHLQDRLKMLLETCPLGAGDPRKRLRVHSASSDEGALDLDERDGVIDYISHYRLVDPEKLESYGKAFVVEDTDENNVLSMDEAKVALEGIPSLQGLGARQMHYIMKILGIDDATMVTFKMFAVVSALCERLLEVMDEQTKKWMEVDDLLDIERKLELYRQMFYWNISSERSPNFIKASSLRVELIAGGVSRSQEDEVMARIETNVYREVSFIDYMAFVPLFLCAHENIVENPLDNSRDKFKGDKEHVFVPEKDMVPLGRPMKRSAALDMKSIPIPYVFEKRPGSSIRKRLKLCLPKPPVQEAETPDSLATPVMSPVPPKMSRIAALKLKMKKLRHSDR